MGYSNFKSELLKLFPDCAYCGAKFNPDIPALNFSLDHFIPKTMGGANEITNLLPCCLRCNGSKAGHLPDEWYTKQPFFSARRWEQIANHTGWVGAKAVPKFEKPRRLIIPPSFLKNAKTKFGGYTGLDYKNVGSTYLQIGSFNVAELMPILKVVPKVTMAITLVDNQKYYLSVSKSDAKKYLEASAWQVVDYTLYLDKEDKEVLLLGQSWADNWYINNTALD
jgi:hypothetical protein